MKLYISPTSPYAKKTTLCVQHHDLHSRVEVLAINPLEEDAATVTGNVLGKIPVLVCDDGTPVYDSPVICEYLDSLAKEPDLFPREGQDRWTALTEQATGDGILDAAFNTVIEKRRPEANQSEFWIERWRGVIERGLVQMSEDIQARPDAFTIGSITYLAVLGYLDLRFADFDWRDRFAALDVWMKRTNDRIGA